MGISRGKNLVNYDIINTTTININEYKGSERMLNKQDLIDMIDKGENSYIEFKEEGVKAKDLAREIVSFANMGRGICAYYI